MLRRSGFTLVELLIATAIFSVIALTLYAGFHGGVLSYGRIDSTLGLCQQARLLLGRIERDIKGAYAFKAGEPHFKGNSTALSFMSVADAFDERGKPLGQVARIEYGFANGMLQRSILKGLAAFTPGEQPLVMPIADNVASCLFSFAAPSIKTPGALEWQEGWPSGEEQGGALPLAVRIQVELRMRQAAAKAAPAVFTKVIPLSYGQEHIGK